MRKAEIIYGRNLKNKDSYVFSEIKNIIDGSDKVLYIVPEQYAFSADKTVLFKLGEKYSHLTETINFKRMAILNNSKLNPTKKDYITEEIKNLILYKIYLENLSSFKALSKGRKSPDTILIFKDILTELKSNLITIEDLEKVISSLPKETFLYNKLCDLKLISQEYEKYISENYRDFEDGFALLAKNITEHNLYKDYHIYIDNFVHFSKSELMVVKALMKNAKSVHFTLLCDEFDSEEGDLFYLTCETASTLTELAEDEGYLLTKTLCDAPDTKNLKSIFEGTSTEVYQNIILKNSKTHTDEVRSVVMEIKRLVSDGASYRDIAVFSGDMEVYSHIISAQFKMAGIPYFDDKKNMLSKNPVCGILTSAFSFFLSDFSLNEMICYLNSLDFLFNKKESICLFEKTVTSFRLEKDTVKNKEKWETSLDTALLGNTYLINRKNEISYVYENMVLPVVDAFSPLKKENVSIEYSDSIKVLIKLLDLEKRLKKYAEDSTDIEKAREMISAYNTMISAIKNISLINGQEKIGKEDYFMLLNQSLQVYKTGVLPNCIDSVTVSDTQRGRSEDKKYIFVLGLNDGITPKTEETTGFLSDSDRKLIKSVTGTELPTAIWRNNSSMLAFYRVCNLADDTLYISKSKFSDEGNELTESFMWSRFEEKVGNVQEFSDIYVNESEAVRTAVASYDKESEFYKYVENENKDFFSEIESMTKEEYFSVNKKVSKKLLDSKFNKKLGTSVSRLETYRKCGYSYFLRYLLKLEEPENATFDFAKSGTLIHNIIDRFSKKLSQENMDWNEINEDFINDSLKGMVWCEIMENFPKINMFNPRVKYMASRLQRTAKTAIMYIKEHFKKGEFVPLGYEIPVNENGVKPISVALDDGSVVEIYGRIDRADGFFDKESDRLYIRIIDYKSSSKSIDFSLVKEGIQIQLLTYLHTLVENGYEYLDFKGEILPGAALYMACDQSMKRFDTNPADEEIEKAVKDKFMLNGIILNDDDVISAIDREFKDNPTYKTDVADISVKNGVFNIKNLLYREQFKTLLTDCENLIRETGQKIIDGEFYIKPYRFGEKNACEWCSYKSICSFDNTVNSYRYIPKLSKDEYFTMEGK